MRILKALTLGAALVALPAAAQAQEFEWRIATFDSETGSYYNNFLVPFTELVGELTNGEVVLEPVPGSAMGNIFRIYEAVEDGLVEMAMMPPAFLGTQDPFNAMIGGLPTGLGVDAMVPWMYYGGGEDILRAHRAERMGMHSFFLGSGPSELFAHSHVEITSVDDLTDVSYRTLGNWAAIIQDAFGATPTTVPGSEIYGLLERRGLDMTEYSTPSENLKQGYQEVAPYIIFPGIHASAFAFEGVTLLENWEELPEAYQKAIHLAARITTYEGMNRFVMADLDAMETLQAGNNQFIELSAEFREKSEAAARTWGRKVSEAAAEDGNPHALALFESITAFQDKWRANSKYMVVDHRD
ncbi:MAG: C4-dicarboxylate ABC transporter substrate-binding protein [Pseudomonadota bacterium]